MCQASINYKAPCICIQETIFVIPLDGFLINEKSPQETSAGSMRISYFSTHAGSQCQPWPQAMWQLGLLPKRPLQYLVLFTQAQGELSSLWTCRHNKPFPKVGFHGDTLLLPQGNATHSV